jgi:hypothetical protein
LRGQRMWVRVWEYLGVRSMVGEPDVQVQVFIGAVVVLVHSAERRRLTRM